MNSIEEQAQSLAGRYTPVARYFQSGDFVEYVREDRPCVYRRIDQFLTLALDIETRRPIGFRLKGFHNFFLSHLQPRYRLLDDQFVALVSVIEVAVTKAGFEALDTADAKSAYTDAYNMAFEDNVELRDLPEAA
jgi:hypothetical protein